MALTLPERARTEIDPIKGSRFIATAAPVASDAEARAVLEELRAEMPDATHHCSAWRIASPSIDRALDDGEPSGSAGRPILSQLTGRDLVDTIVIVTRYYGGTKLGVGGLVRAYGSATAAVLDTLTPIPHVQTTTLTLEYAYADANAVDHVLTQHNIPLTPPTFTETIQRTIQAPLPTEPLQQALTNTTAGRIRVCQLGDVA